MGRFIPSFTFSRTVHRLVTAALHYQLLRYPTVVTLSQLGHVLLGVELPLIVLLPELEDEVSFVGQLVFT